LLPLASSSYVFSLLSTWLHIAGLDLCGDLFFFECVCLESLFSHLISILVQGSLAVNIKVYSYCYLCP
jgi:hypothetical protein